MWLNNNNYCLQKVVKSSFQPFELYIIVSSNCSSHSSRTFYCPPYIAIDRDCAVIDFFYSDNLLRLMVEGFRLIINPGKALLSREFPLVIYSQIKGMCLCFEI